VRPLIPATQLVASLTAGAQLVVAVGLVLSSCSRGQDAVGPGLAPDSQVEAAVALQYAGCLRVAREDSAWCELSAQRSLTLWCFTVACPLQVTSDRGLLSLARNAEVEQGARFELVVPKGVRAITLQVGEARRTLHLADALDHPALSQARELRERGNLAQARQLLERLASQLEAEPAGHAEVARAHQEIEGAASQVVTQSAVERAAAGPLSARGVQGSARAALIGALGAAPTARGALQAGPLPVAGGDYLVLRRRARAELARIALQEADYAAAASGLLQSFDEAMALGRVSEAISDGTALSFVLSANLRRFEQARGVLARVETVAAKDDTGRALLPHYQGVLALETGDLRLALRLFREAVRATARLGLREHELLAREQEAWTLSLLGQHAAAIAAQRVLADSVDSENGCKRADRFESVVWYALLAGASDTVLTDIARNYSERAGRALQGCTSPWRQRNHAVNAGLLAEQRGDLAAVQAALQTLSGEQAVEDPVLEAWELLLRGRYALQAGAAERALATFQQALTACQRHGLWEPELLAQLGVARALKALRGPVAALQAYRDAEDLLDRSLQRAPLAEGLGGARHAREAGTYELMELLLQQRDTAAALAVARRARARSLMLHSAQERVPSLTDHDRARWENLLTRYHRSREQTATLRETAWQLPRARQRERTREIADSERTAREALDDAMGLVLANAWREQQPDRGLEHGAGPDVEPEGRATLALFAGVHGMHGFVYGCGPLRHLELGDAEQAAAWLAPFVSELACASELRVIAPASLSGIDVASWELDGVPVLERWAVSYGLDVPQRTAAANQQGTLRVVDPRANLPLAAREADLSLPSAFAPLRAWTGTAANRGDVLSELPGLVLFHYAGHHRFAGAEGADSELLLAGATLSVGDVLTLKAAPRFVVLSACDSARLEAPGFSAGMDLAYAFVLSGTQAVVAATRPVHDELGYAMSQALYAELAAEPGERDLVRALRAAQLRIRRELPAADWSAFRVITH